jgi:Cys-tRNA(Pro)/Cys-tRNA(Cys) deacylase
VQALAKAGVPFTLHEYAHADQRRDYGVEAVEALGLDPARTFKTLVAAIESDPRTMVVGVVPVAAQLDLRALGTAAGVKHLVMADVTAAEKATGYVAGGISPIGHRRRLAVFVDESARALPSVCVSGGRRGLEIELAPDDLVRASGGEYAPIAR